MLKKFIKILFQNIVVFLAIFGVQASFADDLGLFSNRNVSNRQIVKDIEKFLVFDDESKKRINFYKKGRAIREIEVEEGSTSKTKDSPSSFKIMVVDEKPLPPLLKFNTCAVATEVTLIVCANSLARLLSVRLNVTLLVLDDRLSPIWPSSAAVLV